MEDREEREGRDGEEREPLLEVSSSISINIRFS